MPSELQSRIRYARNRCVPIIAIETADCAEALREIVADANGGAPVVRWDVASGTTGANEAGVPLAVVMGHGNYSEDLTAGSTEGLGRLLAAAASSVSQGTRWSLCILNAHRFVGDVVVMQAIANLRDACKTYGCTIFLLGCAFRLPPELSGDVLIIDQHLPDAKRLGEIAEQCASDAGQKIDNIGSVVDSVTGLAAFAAEQSVALAMTKSGIDISAAWERKRKQVEQTPGLSIWRGGEKFNDIGGVENAKAFVGRILSGESKPKGIVFIDEIEKAMAGARGDTSGVSQDMLGVVLSHMQDTNAAGMIFLGIAGSSKSMMAKAAGNEAGVPTIKIDMGAMKGSLVGESEGRIRQALQVVSAVTGGSSLWIATSNSISDLPPELRRRFTLGTFFFDLPDDAERRVIWDIWHGKIRGGKADQIKSRVAASKGWTGAEIRQCLEVEWRCGISFDDAKTYVVPISVSAKQQIDSLRQSASGRFLSANKPGIYRCQSETTTASGRTINLKDE